MWKQLFLVSGVECCRRAPLLSCVLWNICVHSLLIHASLSSGVANSPGIGPIVLRPIKVERGTQLINETKFRVSSIGRTEIRKLSLCPSIWLGREEVDAPATKRKWRQKKNSLEKRDKVQRKEYTATVVDVGWVIFVFVVEFVRL